MEVDGKTTSQVVQAPAGITDYDVSLQTGAIAYVTENDLMILRPDESTPVKILDEIPQDDSDGFYVHHTISFPVWSHDGTKLAFLPPGIGLYFYLLPARLKTLRPESSRRR